MKIQQWHLLRALIVGASTMVTASGWAQGTWTTNAPILRGVTEAAGVSYGGQFYVIGGGDGSGVSPLQAYNSATGTWSNKTAAPVPLGAAAAVVISNKIYVAEGWVASDANASTTALKIYDPAADTWSTGASSSVARGMSASAAIGGKLYITSGNAAFASGDIATLEIYNPNTDTWSTGAPIPVASEGPVGAAINGKFYVVGGYVRSQSQATANLYIYDPISNSWTTGASMPARRQFASGGVINGELFITGGNGGINNPVFIYNPTTDKWSTGAAEPTPRAQAAAAVMNGKLFVAGGNSSISGPPILTQALETFTPDAGVDIEMFAGVIVNGPLGSNYLIQATSNLPGGWTTLTNVALPSQPYIYIDYSSPKNRQQFYRASPQ